LCFQANKCSTLGTGPIRRGNNHCSLEVAWKCKWVHYRLHCNVVAEHL
jgi:hypothetical protein